MKLPLPIRLIFIKENLLLVFGLVWLWFSIGLYVDSHYTIQDLKPHIGRIVGLNYVIVKVKDKPFFKQTTRQLRLRLSSENNIYILETTDNFNDILSRISIGDFVTLYTKPKKWKIFGMKKSAVINHLVKGSEVIIGYETYKNSISGIYYATFIFSAILLIIYPGKLRKRIWWDYGGYERSVGRE